MALADAASKRPTKNLELRSDNGCHYGSKIFRDEIRRLGIDHTRTMVNTPKAHYYSQVMSTAFSDASGAY
jgi:transposase InsO family protein